MPAVGLGSSNCVAGGLVESLDSEVGEEGMTVGELNADSGSVLHPDRPRATTHTTTPQHNTEKRL